MRKLKSFNDGLNRWYDACGEPHRMLVGFGVCYPGIAMAANPSVFHRWSFVGGIWLVLLFASRVSWKLVEKQNGE